MPLDAVAKSLNLYDPAKITSPSGVGARVYADLAEEKIGKVLQRKGIKVKTGVLVANPDSDKETQHPIAVICEFAHTITDEEISFTHQLCWNFCRSPLLIVIEPTLVRAFSCYESPIPSQDSFKNLPLLNGNHSEQVFDHPKPVREFEIKGDEEISDESKAAIEALQWVELVSGNFFKQEKSRFPREQRADKTLLANLQFIREKLHKEGLEYDTIHDLLARLIFIQFLFQREDSDGRAAITPDYLKKLYQEKKLSKLHKDLPEILYDYSDAYKFFRLLNDRFNGDLFPGNKEEAWQEEKAKVKAKHLKTLADFISGEFDQQKGQGFFWKRYSFDTIPLEFISSIYEEFVSQDQHAKKEKKKNPNKRDTGVYYTKSHLVDFILDNVLPWKPNGKSEWDLKILDPSCGSGIFLVKAFQRLVQRWKNHQSNLNRKYSSRELIELLTQLLENNLFGVDVDPAAVRVASFSLYLAMCDEIDPRTLWEEATFPDLRNEQVVARDFFDDDEDKPLFKQNPNIKYDLIIGNAPWGANTLKKSDIAKNWAKKNGWEISYNNLGPLFLPKAASLAKDDCLISLIQPALPLLTGQSGTADRFRRRLFKEFQIEEVVNLSDFRNILFDDAIYPACIITMRSTSPTGQPIIYICPKRRGTDEDLRQIVIEPMDENFVLPNEAVDKPWIWTVLMHGSRRDVSVIERLQSENTVAKMEAKSKALTRQGLISGDQKGTNKNLDGKKILLDNVFPEGTFLTLNTDNLPEVKDIKFHSKDSRGINSFDSFNYPQMFIKHSWQRNLKRFTASLIKSNSKKGTLCSRNYLNLHSEQLSFLKSATLTFNSSFATYYLMMTDGSFGFGHPKPLIDSFWQVPIPNIREKYFEQLDLLGKKDEAVAVAKLDKTVLRSLELSESDVILINDFFDYSMSDFTGKVNSAGRLSTTRKNNSELKEYCETFIKVVKAGFGQDKEVRATIFKESGNEQLPIRMVAIYLDFPERDEKIKIEESRKQELWRLLEKLNQDFLQSQSESGSIFYQRVARIYQNATLKEKEIPTVYLVKPDQKRYWLRSQALNDADEVSADIVNWFQQQKRSKK